MKQLKIITALMFMSNGLFAQYTLTKQQQYMINEWRDAYGGQIYYAYNYPKTYDIYKQLVSYSGMDYPIVFGQTFNWGQAHNGGLIIIDYSSINKNKNILAFVFAHEWGHQALGHQANIYHPSGSAWKYRSSSTQSEDEADIYSGKFLGTYGYDINIVYNYLYSLPVTDDHTHSTGKERAELVKRGYNSVRGSSSIPSSPKEEYETITVECTHLSHPRGDLIPCSHQAHPLGDLVQCGHVCYNPSYGNVPCHPNGDIIPCSHPAHYNGDVIPCTHLMHPNGDTKRVRKY
jgi:hypothetical protein